MSCCLPYGYVPTVPAIYIRMRISVRCQMSKKSPETNLELRETTHLRHSFGTKFSLTELVRGHEIP